MMEAGSCEAGVRVLPGVGVCKECEGLRGVFEPDAL